jgi:hypothetical protein
MMQGSTHELIEDFKTPLGFEQQGRAGLADLAAGIVANKAPTVKLPASSYLTLGIDE